jgi:hypothetical protein
MGHDEREASIQADRRAGTAAALRLVTTRICVAKCAPETSFVLG